MSIMDEPAGLAMGGPLRPTCGDITSWCSGSAGRAGVHRPEVGLAGSVCVNSQRDLTVDRMDSLSDEAKQIYIR